MEWEGSGGRRPPHARMNPFAICAPLALLFGLLLLPAVSGHGFGGFELSGVQGLEPAGSPNSTFTISKHGEPTWRFEISFSVERADGNGSRPAILIEVVHLASVVSQFRGPAGALTVPTEDRLDYWVNWTNPTPDRLKLRFRVALLGPPTPLELSVILALGAAVLTLTVVVLAIDGMHAVARADRRQEKEGYTSAAELSEEMKANEKEARSEDGVKDSAEETGYAEGTKG